MKLKWTIRVLHTKLACGSVWYDSRIYVNGVHVWTSPVPQELKSAAREFALKKLAECKLELYRH